jgi:hypothetical protein
MRTTRTLLLAATATIAAGAAATLAHAGTSDSHVMTIQLPNGAIEQIRYAGDVPPDVVLSPEPVTAPNFQPVMEQPFALLERISAEIDRQAAAMSQAANTMIAQPMPGFGGLTEASPGRLPAGSQGYSTISTFSGNGVCTRSVQITYPGDGNAPRVQSRTSGNCGPAQGAATPAELPPSPVPARQPGTIEVRQSAPAAAKPYQGMLHQIGDWMR